MAIKAKGFVRHDGVNYKPGDVIKKIKNAEEDRMIELGIAEEFEEPKKEKGPKEDPLMKKSEEELKKIVENMKLELPSEFTEKEAIVAFIRENDKK
jgi:hypothetical protein